jgi:hypothetical protein
MESSNSGTIFGTLSDFLLGSSPPPKVSMLSEVVKSTSTSATTIHFPDVEYVESIKVYDPQKNSVHQQLESKIALLTLLLEQKSNRIAEQGRIIHELTSRISNSATSTPFASINSTPTSSSTPGNPSTPTTPFENESKKLEESRFAAMSLVHAEALYLNRIARLEEQIAADRLARIDGSSNASLYPLAGMASAAHLEQIIIMIQKVLGIDTDVSPMALESLPHFVEEKVQESKYLSSVVDTQHKRIENLIDANRSNSLHQGLTNLNQLVLALSNTPDIPDELYEIACNALESVTRDSKQVVDLQKKLDSHLALNKDLKNLIISSHDDASHIFEISKLREEIRHLKF